MHRVRHIREIRAQVEDWKRKNLKIGYIPTMGNLHAGHLSLIDQARQHCDRLVSSIFVNPLQFGENEDFGSYPRSIEADCTALMEHDCDLVFLPDSDSLYPQGLDEITVVDVLPINQDFEGVFRPGHLQGVATVVLKLFNLVQPDLAAFGKKDYQQWRMIEKMVRDLNLPIDVMGVDTVREDDGLALSSRNQYLSSGERQTAAELQRQLSVIAGAIKTGEDDFNTLCEQARADLEQSGFSIDYLDICHRETLQLARAGDPLVVLSAAQLGSTRLIDNLEI
jgi:pantoate--beta-alanine ligase